jgi:NADH-ubiquinone oxidoreductase chain 2
LLALGFSILLFSFAGIPPFAGFYSKMFVLFSGINSGLIFFSIVILVLNIVGCFYYIRFIKTGVFESAKQLLETKDVFFINNFRGGWFSLMPVNRECSLVLAFILFFIVFAGFFSSSIYFVFSFLSHLILFF